jgi:Raf kinase inhibitor-like YbhB/YbcL family protein
MGPHMENLSLRTRIRKGSARALRHLTLVLLLVCSGCLAPGEKGVLTPMEVKSDAFAVGGQIPGIFTCDGEDISPPLAWDPVPDGTAALAILVTDTDAPGGTFVHWVAYNIPPGTRSIPAGSPGKDALPRGSIEGMNDMGRAGYRGPCPPGGKPHHYHFTMYALDSVVNVTGARDGRMLLGAMEGHIIAQGEIVGIYQRA